MGSLSASRHAGVEEAFRWICKLFYAAVHTCIAFVLLVDHIDRGHLPVWNKSLAIFIDKKQEAREERTGIACHTHCSACTRTIGLLLRAQWAEEACTRADPPSVQALRQGIVERVAAAGGRVDYVEVPHRPWS